MASYSVSVKTNRLRVVRDAIDGKTFAAGTGAGAGGYLVIGTVALSGAVGVLCLIALPNPMGSEAGGVLTLAGVPLAGIASGSGTAAVAEFRDSAGNVIVEGLTVGLSGADILISSLTIVGGQTITVTSGSISHA